MHYLLTLFTVGALCFGACAEPPVEGSPGADAINKPPSEQTYQAHYRPGAKLHLDGRADELAWAKANVDNRFTFPWEKKTAPATEFRALCDGKYLWFTFHVTDPDIVVLDKLRDEQDEVFEDRVEVYFSKDDKLHEYYCIEIDSRGRVFDYSGSFWRKLDTKWNWPGVEAKGSTVSDGYVIEARIPIASFKKLGFPTLKPGAKIRCGLYRAEFSHDRSGRKVEQTASIHNLGRTVEGPLPIEEWVSWIDPKVVEPDFHIPATFGWLEIVK